MKEYKNKKKVVLIVAGIGDTLCSSNSTKKIKNNESFVEQVKKVVKHVTDDNYYALVNFHYPSDTFKDVNVFADYPKSREVGVKIHSNSLLLKDNELTLNSRDGEELLFNGDDFTFVFRPEEYDVYMCGIDLHGIFANSIKDLLAQGYKINLFSDCLSAFPQTHRYINTLQKNKNFEFCSYKSV